MLLTVPFVIYGIFRVLFLIALAGSRLPGDPTELVWRDRPLQACIVLWGLTAASSRWRPAMARALVTGGTGFTGSHIANTSPRRAGRSARST